MKPNILKVNFTHFTVMYFSVIYIYIYNGFFPESGKMQSTVTAR